MTEYTTKQEILDAIERGEGTIATLPIKLTCECCGFEEAFDSCQAAFDKGWDCPPWFTAGPICCHLCPAVAAMGMVDHTAAHAKWEKEGRPEEFTLEGLPPL